MEMHKQGGRGTQSVISRTINGTKGAAIVERKGGMFGIRVKCKTKCLVQQLVPVL